MALRRLSTSSLTNPKWYRDGSAGLGPYTDFELIDETVLTTSAASVTFSNLGDYSTIYKHLQLRMVAAHNSSGDQNMRMQMNGDTGGNYNYHFLLGSGSSVSSGNSTSDGVSDRMFLGNMPSSTTAFHASVTDILDPYETKNKTIRTLTGNSSSNIWLTSGLWRNTASLTSIVVFPGAGSFVQSSRFSLFGIKGA